MSTLGKRVDSLEEIAEEVRLRPIRVLAAERGIPAAVLMANYEEVHARNERLRAQGYSRAQIVADVAERIGCTVEEIAADTALLAERFGLTNE